MNQYAKAGSGLLLAFVSSVLSLGNLNALCQLGISSSSDESARHDLWMMVPAELLPSPGDQATLQLLTERGKAFDQYHATICGTGIPLDQPQVRTSRTGCGFAADYALGPELPLYPDETIIVARFSDYQTFLTPSRLTIYTSIHLLVEQVLQSGPTAAKPGTAIENLIYGGTVKLGGKIIHEGLFQDSAYTLQPNHRYLLFLNYQRDGNYFTIVKSWELMNGIAVPNHPTDVARMQRGTAQYSGLPEKPFIDAVQEAIRERDMDSDIR